MTEGRERLVGAAYATAAYGFWGIVPAYWRTVSFASPLEMVAHRVLWAVPCLALLVARRRRFAEAVAAAKDTRHRRLLAGTALLVSANWLVFIWAVREGHVLDASLGYFITPLVNALLGVVVLRERLSRPQVLAVLLAGFGVVWLAVHLGSVPWISLALAGTFSLYGLLRKQAGVDALVGLAVESAFLAPVALVYLLFLLSSGASAFLRFDAVADLKIVASGPITALPLLWFAHAARRLRYVTLGFFQYLAPTGQFLLAVFAYGETLTPHHGVAFACIWTAIALFMADALRRTRSA